VLPAERQLQRVFGGIRDDPLQNGKMSRIAECFRASTVAYEGAIVWFLLQAYAFHRVANCIFDESRIVQSAGRKVNKRKFCDNCESIPESNSRSQPQALCGAHEKWSQYQALLQP